MKKETKNVNAIEKMFDRNFHFVSRTEGENYARFAPTRRSRPTSLFGGWGPCRCLEGSGAFRRRHSKRVNKTMPTRHLSVLPKAFNIDFTWGLPLSFPMFLKAQVRRATVTSSRQRAGVFNEGRTASLEKKYQGRFQAWSCDLLRHRTGRRTRAPVRDVVFDMAAGNTWHCQQERVIKDVVLMWTRGVGQRCSSACTHIRLEWFNFLSFFFELCQKLSFKFMINAILTKDSTGKENQARLRETGTWKDIN